MVRLGIGVVIVAGVATIADVIQYCFTDREMFCRMFSSKDRQEITAAKVEEMRQIRKKEETKTKHSEHSYYLDPSQFKVNIADYAKENHSSYEVR